MMSVFINRSKDSFLENDWLDFLFKQCVVLITVLEYTWNLTIQVCCNRDNIHIVKCITGIIRTIYQSYIRYLLSDDYNVYFK